MQARHDISSPPSSAFSLVELSIVLVILGLLVGGILAGQSLIRASELRSVTAEYQRYQTAVHAFRDKYFALPGDMAGATGFWGKDAAKCNGQSGTAAMPGTCNGDGDGYISYSSASASAEAFRFWQQLALAGLIEGNYSGNAGSGGMYQHVLGVNCPPSKLSGACWTSSLVDKRTANDGFNLNVDYRNWFTVGSIVDIYFSGGPLLRTEEAWNIDTKIDDGRPGAGKVHATISYSYCTTAAGSSDFTGTYKLANGAANQCALLLQY